MVASSTASAEAAPIDLPTLIAERDLVVVAGFAGQTEDAFADDVALDLVGAAPERRCERRKAGLPLSRASEPTQPLSIPPTTLATGTRTSVMKGDGFRDVEVGVETGEMRRTRFLEAHDAFGEVRVGAHLRHEHQDPQDQS